MPTTMDIVWILCGFAEMFWSFAFIFFYCEFGEMVTNQFYEFDDQLYQCGWYLLSMELKQSYLAFLSYTEQPANIRCFGNLLCTREVFKKVKGVALYGRKFNKTTFYDIFSSYLDHQERVLLSYDTSPSTCLKNLIKQTETKRAH